VSGSVFWEAAIILLLILANGVFAAAEISIIAARRGRLISLAEAGDRWARKALDLGSNPSRFLSTVQIGMTLVSTLAAAFGGARMAVVLAELFAQSSWEFLRARSGGIALAIVVLVISFLQLVIGELVPKRLALKHAEVLARLMAPLMYFVYRASRPAVWLLERVTDFLLWVLRSSAPPDASVTIADIEHLIDTSMAEGTLEQIEQKVALEALRLGDRTVRDIMRPRVDLDALDVTTPEEEVIGAVAMAGFSRLPVYEKDLDHIVGFVHMKDLFCAQHMGQPIDLRHMLHPALFVPASLPLDGLLEQFQEKQTQLAIVVDEHGGTDGMVTLEDVIEELVGEIRDEHRRDQVQDFVTRDDNTWLVDGGVSINDLLEKLDAAEIELPEPRTYATLSGLILAQLGEIPLIGARTQWGYFLLEVIDMDGQRIDRVLITRLPSPDTSEKA